ncbi:hypothetical protein AOQ84DRAFT_376753 [Glonium stellatum]|uniref:Uncharacterized protein n=1 Tax=Glonium stellatum TaxID=574774 RepID=A0A8E2JTE2_9PEZI|nr:hypothetical protein AOQ84DRAFT_376753 [Glonium stellatum]
MERTDQNFVDGLALDLLPPANRTLVVQQNTAPLFGSFVTGNSGELFMSLSNYSWVIVMNETANDLIAKIELPYDPDALAQLGVNPDNTMSGRSRRIKSCGSFQKLKETYITENKTRIIEMTSIDGEYMLLGRKIADTASIFVQYGQGATRTMNVTRGAGIQEAEFIDGLRFSVQSTHSFTMNVELRHGT